MSDQATRPQAVGGEGAGDARYRHGFRWFVLAVFSLTYGFALFAIMSLAGMAGQVMGDYGIDQVSFSFLTTVPYLTGFVTCLFFGGFVDRLGARKVVLAALVVGAAGCALRAAVPEYWAFVAGNFLIGFMSSAVTASVAKTLGAWFSPKQFGFAMGVYIAVGSLGTAIGMSSASLFSSIQALLWFCLAFCAVCFVAMAFAKNSPVKEASEEAPQSVTKYLGVALRNKSVWIASIGYFLLFGAVAACSVFMVDGLQQLKGASEAEAGFASTLGICGAIFGSVILASVASKVGRAKPCILVYGVVGIACNTVAWVLPWGVWTMPLLFCLTFFWGGAMAVNQGLPGQIPDLAAEYVGAGGGFLACLQNLGAFVIPTCVLSPIAGSDYFLFYMLLSVVAVVYVAWMVLLPKGVGVTR